MQTTEEVRSHGFDEPAMLFDEDDLFYATSYGESSSANRGATNKFSESVISNQVESINSIPAYFTDSTDIYDNSNTSYCLSSNSMTSYGIRDEASTSQKMPMNAFIPSALSPPKKVYLTDERKEEFAICCSEFGPTKAAQILSQKYGRTVHKSTVFYAHKKYFKTQEQVGSLDDNNSSK